VDRIEIDARGVSLLQAQAAFGFFGSFLAGLPLDKC
jgi:hypothetical protein